MTASETPGYVGPRSMPRETSLPENCRIRAGGERQIPDKRDVAGSICGDRGLECLPRERQSERYCETADSTSP